MKVKIVRASGEHVDQIVDLAENSGLSRWPRSEYESAVSRANVVFLCAGGPNEDVVGFIIGRVLERGDAEIFNIGVGRGLRRQGAGTELIYSFIRSCEERGAKAIWLEVREANSVARKFYEKMGFREVSVRKEMYTDPVENAIVMCRNVLPQRA